MSSWAGGATCRAFRTGPQEQASLVALLKSLTEDATPATCAASCAASWALGTREGGDGAAPARQSCPLPRTGGCAPLLGEGRGRIVEPPSDEQEHGHVYPKHLRTGRRVDATPA